jgi:hypothetical protein
MKASTCGSGVRAIGPISASVNMEAAITRVATIFAVLPGAEFVSACRPGFMAKFRTN